MYYNITSSWDFTGVSIILEDGSTLVVDDNHPRYADVIAGLIGNTLTEEDVFGIVSPFDLIYKKLTKLSERVSRKGNKILFDGDVIKNALTDHIVEIMNGGDENEWKAYVRFMERLYENPSEQSREHLFHYIEGNGLQITPDGYLSMYKGTRDNGEATHQGYGIVNGIEFENAYLLNSLGAIVEIPRSMVDENRGATCSVGLHVGAFEYMKTSGMPWTRAWRVLVNPRDVVSVPHDYNSSKIRVSRYQIVEDLGSVRDAVKHEGRVWDPQSVDQPVETAKLDEPAREVPDGSRIPEYENVIRALLKADPNANLKRYRSKRVTQNRRDEFKKAAENLGFKL